MMDADARVARVGHRAVAARQQQGVAGDRNRDDPRRIERMGRAQVEAGIDHRMHHDSGRIRLEGVARKLPARAELADQRGDIRLVAGRARPAQRALDRCQGRVLVLAGEQRRHDAAARRIADAGVLGRGRQVFDQSRGQACGDPERIGAAIRVEPEQPGGRRCRSEHAAGRGDVPAAGVVPGRHRQSDPAGDFAADRKRLQHVAAGAAAPLRQRQGGGGHRRGRMDDGRQMGVVVIEQVDRDRIDERRARRVHALPLADQDGLVRPGDRPQRARHRGDDRIARRAKGGREPVEQRAPGGLLHGRRKILPARGRTELTQRRTDGCLRCDHGGDLERNRRNESIAGWRK